MQLSDVSHVIYRAFDLINSQSVREFSVPPQTFIGAGAITKCGEAIADRALNRVFVMVDSFLHQQKLDEALYRSLDNAAIHYEVMAYQGGEPTTKAVEEATQQLLAAQCDSVLALGGGSVLDAAKVTALLATNSHLTLSELVDSTIKPNRRLPLVAIPTTAGTGSEATNVAVITDPITHMKQVIAHKQLIPDLAIMDACLTLGLPPEITAITGIDALTHAIETYVACHSTPLTRGFAHRAITLISEALPHAVGQGHDIKARESMMLASYMAGMAFSNAGLGLCHAMAHPIGGEYHIPHGYCNAMLLPAVMRFNQLVCKKEYAEIGHALTGKPLEAEATIDKVQQLIHEVGLCKTLSAFGGKESNVATLANDAMKDICLQANPRTVAVEQIMGIYQEVLAC